MTTETNWQLAERRVRTRLLLACSRTLTADQRALVVSSVIIPALLYVGRHAWPTSSIVKRLSSCIHNFVSHGCFEESSTGRKAWVLPDIAGLQRSEGGLALPDLNAELLAMAAVSVEEWASKATRVRRLVGDILCAIDHSNADGMTYITPGYSPRSISGFGRRRTLFSVDVTMILHFGAQPLQPGHHTVVREFIRRAQHVILESLAWIDHSVTIDCREFGTGHTHNSSEEA
ncbi:unnamed protein product [Phytophthora fragariaefolia]|uniref:Unnamed protein product n=1 Tax=Phytophthora fragariaefolia TaxID=1490495 RepID=A0A9W7CUK2_9STRA|nr:unnamed protein product [Phytophthora fragariaefolia]